MKKYAIKCDTCDEIMGSVTIDLSDRLLEEYRQTMTCSNGHMDVTLIEVEEIEQTQGWLNWLAGLFR